MTVLTRAPTPLELRVIADELRASRTSGARAPTIERAADELERMQRRIDDLEEFCRGVATNCTRIAGER